MKFAQATEISKDSRWKGSQMIPCYAEDPEAFQTVKNVFIQSRQTSVAQVKSPQSTEILRKTFWKCSQPVALQEVLVS